MVSSLRYLFFIHKTEQFNIITSTDVLVIILNFVDFTMKEGKECFI